MNSYSWLPDLKAVNSRSLFHNSLADLICQKLVKKKGVSLLDVGAAAGSTAIELLQQKDKTDFSRIVLIEPSAEGIIELKKLAAVDSDKISVLESTLEKSLEEKSFDGEFDLILLSHIVYYIKDIARHITMLKDYLKEDGEIMIVVRSVRSDSFLLRKIVGRLVKDTKVNYSEIELKKALRLASIIYEMSEVNYTFPIKEKELDEFENRMTDDHNIIDKLLHLIGHRSNQNWTASELKELIPSVTGLIRKRNFTLCLIDQIFYLKK